jgi:hypothetical protein
MILKMDGWWQLRINGDSWLSSGHAWQEQASTTSPENKPWQLEDSEQATALDYNYTRMLGERQEAPLESRDEEESSQPEDEFTQLVNTIAKHFQERGITRSDIEDAIVWARSQHVEEGTTSEE